MPDHTPPSVTHWFIAHGDGKRGPFAASDLARMLDDGELAGDSLIWREGLSGWSQLRSDFALLTALSAVRGVFEDTTVGSPPIDLVPGEDTVVEPTLEASTHMFAPASALIAPGVRLREPEQQRAAPIAAELDRGPNRPPAGAQETGPHSPVAARSPVPHSWMPSVRSMLLVAGLAFVFGVVVAALWGRLVRGTTSHEQIVFPSLRLGEAREASADTWATEASSPSVTPQPESVSERAAAADAEAPVDALKREIRRVSLDVRRCLPDLTGAVQVEGAIEASSGRAVDVRVTSGALSPGVHACVVQAVKQLQVAPFVGEPLRLSHRFAW